MEHTEDKALLKACDLVQDFLKFYGFVEASKAFNIELNTRSLKKPVCRSPINSKEDRNLTKELLVSFISDNEPHEFWNMWGTRVSCTLRQEPEGIEIEFWISVYFLTLSYSKASSKKRLSKPDADTLNRFKEFRMTHKELLAKRPECLPYFAFEHIDDPIKHPSFEHLFTTHWRTELIDRVDQFLERLPEKEDIPKLYSLVKESIQLDERQFLSKNENYEKDSEAKVQGQRFNIHAAETGKTTKQSSVSSAEVDGRSAENTISLTDSFASLSCDESKIITETVDWDCTRDCTRDNLETATNLQRQAKRLDYSALGKALLEKDDTEVFKLLQAIRQRLVRRGSLPSPITELQHCIEVDFLRLTQHQSLVEILLARNDMNLTQELLFFIHAFCSESTGRDYLAGLDGIIEILYAALSAVTECENKSATATIDDSRVRHCIQQTTLECLSSFISNDSLCLTMTRIGLLPWLIANLKTMKASDQACSLLCGLVKSQHGETICVKELDRLCHLYQYLTDAQDKQKQALGARILRSIADVPHLFALLQESDEYLNKFQNLETLPVSGRNASGRFDFSISDHFLDEMNNNEVAAEKLLESYYIPTDLEKDKQIESQKMKESLFRRNVDFNKTTVSLSPSCSSTKGTLKTSAKLPGSHLRSVSANNPTRRKYSIPSTYAKDDGLSNIHTSGKFSGHKRNLQDDYMLGFFAKRELPRTPNISKK